MALTRAGLTLEEFLALPEAKPALEYVAGVAVALLVDDRQETIRASRPQVPLVVHQRGDRIALDAVAPGLHMIVDEIFAALDPD